MISRGSRGWIGLGVSLILTAPCAMCSPLPSPVGGEVSAQHGGQGHGQSYLGVDVRDVSDDELPALKLKEARGAEIVHVDHDGPAGKMGLRERDVVMQMNGVAIEGEEQIRRMLHDTAAGRTVVFVILRDGQQMVVTAQMADREEVERQAWERHLNAPLTPDIKRRSSLQCPSLPAVRPVSGAVAKLAQL